MEGSEVPLKIQPFLLVTSPCSALELIHIFADLHKCTQKAITLPVLQINLFLLPMPMKIHG